ncbi:MAG: DUF2461 domain-containing protein [Oscillospiraceae bacterium]|nr:DUF2461 domain-containing protein [Oscillospiraceae bacterium]
MDFTGFPKEFADFLFSLQFTNTAALLPENKLKYKKLISEPLTLLYHSLVPVIADISESAMTKPSKCISTMYNDMRFSKDTPLKGYMYLRFREPFSDKDALGFYFDMGYEYYSYGIRIYKQTAVGMDKIRKGVLDKSKAFADELERLSKTGMTIYGDSFAKDRFPEVNNAVIRELLNKKSFYIGRDRALPSAAFGGELLSEISGAYRELGRVYLLLKDSLYKE